MAISGAAMFGFVIAHLIGNLQIFIGREAINRYGHFLQSNMEIVWPARLGLLVMVGLHIWAAIRLSKENKAARPVAYASNLAPAAASYASRTMLMSGLIILSFIIYHLLHFTVQVLSQYDGTFDGTKAQLAKELTKTFQLTGLIALTILLVLAITSVNAMIRWLGGKAWKNLHRLAYVAAGLAAYHQAAARKIFPMQVVWIFGPLAVLEIARIWKQQRKPARSAVLQPASETKIPPAQAAG